MADPQQPTKDAPALASSKQLDYAARQGAIALQARGGLQPRDFAELWAIAADTDGIDGSEDNAGAIWTPELAHRPGARDFLARHDSYGFFSAAGTLVMTGPTRTNVNDYRAIIVV